MTQPEQHIQPALPAGKSSAKAVVFSVLILISGIIIGAGVTLLIVPTQKPIPPFPENVSQRFIEQLVRELNLTDEQKSTLDPIVAQHMQALDTIRQEARPKIRQELDQMNKDILSVLDDPQKVMFEDRIRQMQEGFQRYRRGPGREGPGREGPGREGPGMRDGRGPGRDDSDWRDGRTGDRQRRRGPGQGEMPPEGMMPPDQGDLMVPPPPGGLPPFEFEGAPRFNEPNEDERGEPSTEQQEP